MPSVLGGRGDSPLVLEGVAAWVRAVVASRGRAERMMEEERLGGMNDGASSGIVSPIVRVHELMAMKRGAISRKFRKRRRRLAKEIFIIICRHLQIFAERR
jgi:hypothetical protein